MLRKISHTAVAGALKWPSWAALSAHSVTPCRKGFAMGSVASYRLLNGVAGSSVDSELPMQRDSEKRRWSRSMISTLNPSEYRIQDIVDLSGARTKHLSFAGCPARESACGTAYGAHRDRATGTSIVEPFPPSTKGVFYFHDRSSVHPVAGDVRFRVLPVDEVQDWSSVDTVDLFARGHDLVDYSGLGPWCISLLRILYGAHPALRDFMKLNGYISEAAEEEVRRLISTKKLPGAVGGGYIVEKVTDPFVLDLSNKNKRFVFLQKEGIAPALVNLSRGTSKSVYSGTVLVRFEAVLVRQGKNQELHKKVALRVLKFLKPPDPSDLVVQQEGELIKQYSHRDKVEAPWIGRAPKFMSPSSLALLEETYLPADARSGRWVRYTGRKSA